MRTAVAYSLFLLCLQIIVAGSQYNSPVRYRTWRFRSLGSRTGYTRFGDRTEYRLYSLRPHWEQELRDSYGPPGHVPPNPQNGYDFGSKPQRPKPTFGPSQVVPLLPPTVSTSTVPSSSQTAPLPSGAGDSLTQPQMPVPITMVTEGHSPATTPWLTTRPIQETQPGLNEIESTSTGADGKPTGGAKPANGKPTTSAVTPTRRPNGRPTFGTTTRPNGGRPTVGTTVSFGRPTVGTTAANGSFGRPTVSTTASNGRPTVNTTAPNGSFGRPTVSSSTTNGFFGRPTVSTTATNATFGRPTVSTTAANGFFGRPTVSTTAARPSNGRPTVGTTNGRLTSNGRPTNDSNGRPTNGANSRPSVGGRPTRPTNGNGRPTSPTSSTTAMIGGTFLSSRPTTGTRPTSSSTRPGSSNNPTDNQAGGSVVFDTDVTSSRPVIFPGDRVNSSSSGTSTTSSSRPSSSSGSTPTFGSSSSRPRPTDSTAVESGGAMGVTSFGPSSPISTGSTAIGVAATSSGSVRPTSVTDSAHSGSEGVGMRPQEHHPYDDHYHKYGDGEDSYHHHHEHSQDSYLSGVDHHDNDSYHQNHTDGADVPEDSYLEATHHHHHHHHTHNGSYGPSGSDDLVHDYATGASTLSPVLMPGQPTDLTLLEVLKEAKITQFLELVMAAGFEKMLMTRGNFTLFVPVDSAFELVPQTLKKLLLSDMERLRSVLLYHLVPFGVLSGALVNGETLITVSPGGRHLKVNIYEHDKNSPPDITINGVGINQADILAKNGVVHFLDKVLLTSPHQTIKNILTENPVFSVFADALVSVNMLDTLSGVGPYTVFVVMNEGAQKLGSNVIDNFPTNSTMEETMKYHIVLGTYFSAGLLDGQFLKTALEGAEIQCGVTSDGYTKRLSTVNGLSRVVKADIAASNGVLHMIDTPLIVDRDLDLLSIV